jgi:hypothetical protein
MPRQSDDAKDETVRGNSSQPDLYQRRLQRILKGSELTDQNLSGGVAPFEQERMSDQMKSATLSPKLMNPSSVTEDEGPLFQCTECDMIVKESDPYCPFCGAIFADGPLAEHVEEVRSLGSPPAEHPPIEKPTNREPFVRPEKFDVFSLIERGSKVHDLMYQEALRGFSGSTRLLEDIERLISNISALGNDTSAARRMMSSAWEACRDGNWNLASTLAKQTEALVEPSIPDLVRSEIARARDYLTRAKASGIDISSYVTRVKSAMAALHSGDPDEALRITKELMDSIREDSISWKK